MANQSAPEEDCSCSDLIMYALLFMSVWQSGLKSCPSSNPEKGLSLLMVNCWFFLKSVLPLCFISWPFIILQNFTLSFYIAFSVAL